MADFAACKRLARAVQSLVRGAVERVFAVAVKAVAAAGMAVGLCVSVFMRRSFAMAGTAPGG